MLKTKIDILQNTIKTKQLLDARVNERIDANEFAYELARNPDMTMAASRLVEDIMNPTPLESLKSVRTNQFIDIGMGVSAFWDEIRAMRQETILERAVEMENVIMSVSCAQEAGLSPEFKAFVYRNAGLTDAQIHEFVSEQEQALDQELFRNGLYDDVMTSLGHAGKTLDELSDDERSSVEMLVDDRSDRYEARDPRPQLDSLTVARPPLFKDVYGIEAKDLYEAMTPEPHRVVFPLPVYADDYKHEHTPAGKRHPLYASMCAYDEIYASTMDDNISELAFLEASEAMAEEHRTRYLQQDNYDLNSPTLHIDEHDLELMHMQLNEPDDLSLDDDDLNFTDDTSALER